jgi:hypothetical protein
MEFAMELAWDVKKWTPQNASKFTNNWANRTFGNEFADRISEIKTEYYALAQSGKPEHIGILRFTETKENERIERYRVITQKAEQVYTYIPIGLKSAYFQLILYPVKAAYLQNQKVFYANQSILLAKQKKPKANELAKASRAAYQEIQNLTQYYNTIENGKWNGIMSAKPRNKNVFRLPILPDDTTAIDVQKLETGLLDQENIKGEVVWDIDSLNYNIIPAGDAMIMHGTSSIQCVSVPFLGCKKNSLTSLPLNRASISDFNNENCPYAEYRLAMHTGKKAIVVKCLATHLINKEHQLRYGISVNEDAVQSIDIESKEYSKKWSSNVLRGYASGKTYHIISKEGDAIVRIYLPDPGVVVSSIEVQE